MVGSCAACTDLATAVPDVTFQQFIWLAAEGEDVVDTADEWVVRCLSCGQQWRDGTGFRGIRKVSRRSSSKRAQPLASRGGGDTR